MKLILRGDLRCPKRGCTAAIVEYREAAAADYRCKVHGSIRPCVKGHVGTKQDAAAAESEPHRYPIPELRRRDTPPPDDAPAIYRRTPGERP